VTAVLQRAGAVAADILAALAVVFSIPFVILAIAVPIVLCVRLLFWLGALV